MEFHQKIDLVHLPIDPNIIKFLAICIFEACLKRIWPETNQLAGLLESQVGTDDYDIISYVGGAVIKSLSTDASGDYLRCVEFLKSSPEEAVYATLIHTKDRGGLTFVGDKTFQLFKKAESLFKLSFNHESEPPTRSTFINQCQALIRDDFYQIFANESFSDAVLEEVLHDITAKYFKIRIHHHGKVIMQRLNQNKSKSLRKGLKK